MRVVGLYVKPRSGAAMVATSVVDGVAGSGLGGDCHREASSPRQVLVFSRAVLDRLALEPAAVRANVVLEGAVDELPSGAALQLGSSLTLRLTIPCEPCYKLEAARPGLARALRGSRGMLARVVAGGRVHVGDPVASTPRAYPPLEESWQERVADIVRNVPDGTLLTYTQLAKVAGIEASYCRALPRVLHRLRAERAIEQADRVVSAKAVARSSAACPFWDGASYFERDEREL